MKAEILKLRKQIFQYLKDKALSYEIGTEELELYFSNQEKYSDREFEVCSMDQLLSRVKETDITFIGDFHTFDQNIRNVLRIIKILITQEQKPIIGLEMIDSQYQLILDTYLEGHLTELEFLEEIDYHDSWRFPWTHYKLIFELAKDHNIQIVALNKKGSLRERDEFAADLLSQINHEQPDKKLIVLYGELHIAPNKMPALLEKRNPKLEQLIIHQNLDTVYWKLAQTETQAETVYFNKNEFCLLTAPPWVKYESMVYWYENLCNDPEFDIHNYIIENGKKIFSDDTHENFSLICEQIINFLGLQITSDQIDHFNLYDHTNLEYVEETLTSSMDTTLRSFYEQLIAKNYSFRFLENKFYCSSYSMNRISYLAGIHLLHFYFEKKNLNSITVLSSSDTQSFFTLHIWEGVFAYFFSKIINPHRKCELYLDFKSESNRKNQVLLDLFETKTFPKELFKKDKIFVFEIANTFGHVVGEYLYQKQTEASNDTLLHDTLFSLSFNFQDFIEQRDKILENINFRQHQKRYF